MWSDWLVFCDCGFHFVCPLMEKDKRIMETSLDWLRGELGLVLMGRAMLSKSLNQFYVNEWSNNWCCKEQYCIGTWNVRSMNQGKLEVVKQEMARVNVDILGISKLKWTGMGEFNSDDHYIYYCGQESLRSNGVAIIVKKKESEVQYLDAISKMTEWSLFVSKANLSISQ